MRVIVTCGPAFEPIDEVRRITNFSTGELGVMLADRLAGAGFDVVCLRGILSTCQADPVRAELETFTTNDDLEAKLAAAAASCRVGAVFHAAALCDYRVRHIQTVGQSSREKGKISSRHGSIMLTLEPATKVISKMRGWFPRALLVGWKYELEGDIETTLGKAERQLLENGTDACVTNGRAFGRDFGFCRLGKPVRHLANKRDLCHYLSEWLEREASRRENSRPAGRPSEAFSRFVVRKRPAVRPIGNL